MWRVALLLSLALVVQASPECRCFPGDACWPSVQQWDEFNSTIEGRLSATIPLGSVCHQSGEFGAYDADACERVIANWEYPVTHYASPASPMSSWWSNFSCDPFLPRDTPCDIGTLQRFSVNVTGVDDVRKTLQFSREHNLRIVIRNTGHDYLGKSTAPGAVALWVHHLKDIHHLRYSSPGYNGSALRIGAGVQGFDAMAAARTHNEVIVIGNCRRIGIAGGYTQGGGHSQLMWHFGLAADQVLEWEVVTADGDHLTVSPVANEDLFWALNGGGGGTFAVVISVTVKTHPEMITSAATLTVDIADIASQTFHKLLRTFIVGILPLVDSGAVAVWSIVGAQFSVTPITLPGGQKQQLQNGLASTLDLLKKHKINHKYSSKEFPTFYDSYTVMTPDANITEAQLGGRLISRSTIDSNVTALVSTVQKLATQEVVVSGISMNISRITAPFRSANPAWRNAGISMVIGTPYNYTSRAQAVRDQSLMTESYMPSLTELSPESGAYLNEADWRTPNWQEEFYGENYPALEAVKFKYDPEHVFWARTAVGSQRWTQNHDGRLCGMGS
ncbi:FAD-linked oxidoreductase sor8 [Penicillium capsulatum]|uniref:FAD-linked oxidoreductase sor8 n=1 Tax=Penicillium capsulatum TaxID=69766 RepID=A0A9W9IAP8_9EURO|nr:FAD-linked oxidoreductase sor8 [Penicillium capsulatum]KAJ6134989.1 FAD-linked oxidoreductase sor8 [Penicillium capsulatum]